MFFCCLYVVVPTLLLIWRIIPCPYGILHNIYCDQYCFLFYLCYNTYDKYWNDTEVIWLNKTAITPNTNNTCIQLIKKTFYLITFCCRDTIFLLRILNFHILCTYSIISLWKFDAKYVLKYEIYILYHAILYYAIPYYTILYYTILLLLS